MDKYTRARRNDFIKRSYRDQADKDYIAARTVHRLHLLDQFLWLALQALEKYLKAILLFNDQSTKGIGHDLVEAFTRVEQISTLGCSLSSDDRLFLEYLTGQGTDRYFERVRSAEGEELLALDHVVWSVRRFCDDYFFPFDPSQNILRKYSRAFLESLNTNSVTRSPHRFRLMNKGFIEEVLESAKHRSLREQLVWKNFYFGNRKKRRICINLTRVLSNPSTFMYPQLYQWLMKNVQLDRKTRALLDQQKVKK